MITLRPVSHKLKEVVITAKMKDFNERKIIRQALARIPQNYPTFPFQLKGYYRDYVLDGINYENLIEAALTVQDQGFKTLDYKQSQIQINQIRSNPVFKTDTLEKKLLYGKSKTVPHSRLADFNGNEFWLLRIHDPIRNYNIFSFSFVNIMKTDFIRNHHFHLDSIVYNESESFYAISFNTQFYSNDINRVKQFENSPEKVMLEVKGGLLVNRKTFGIYRFNYLLSCSSKDYTGDLLEERLEYKEVNSKLFLNYHLLKNYFEYDSISSFKVYQILLDQKTNCIVVRFTQPIHPRYWKDAYIELLVQNKRVKHIQIIPKYDALEIYYDKKNKNINEIAQSDVDAIQVKIENLVSIFKQKLNIPKKVGHFQYREFFTNEIKSYEFLPDSVLAPKNIPLFRVKSENNPEFWNSYNYLLRQPLKD